MTDIATVQLVFKDGRRKIELGSYDFTKCDWRVVGDAINIQLTWLECRRLLAELEAVVQADRTRTTTVYAAPVVDPDAKITERDVASALRARLGKHRVPAPSQR